MEVTWRDAGPEDAPLLGEIGRQSFIETFGHLYTPENLAAFLENHSEENWRGELADPRYAVRLGFVRRRQRRLCEARPALAAVHAAGRQHRASPILRAEALAGRRPRARR